MRIRHLLRALPLPALAAACAACATMPRTDVVPAAARADCVVLLHGLNRGAGLMRPLAEALEVSGYATANVDYPSRSGTVAELVEVSVSPGVRECRELGASRIHFVTHSIGGILVRYAHAREPIADLGRVVMLAPPNQGSEIVDVTGGWPGAGLIGGPAGLELGTRGEKSVPAKLGPVDFELGVIAGTHTISPVLSAMLPDPDDGKVSVANTRVEGMDDFLVVPASHRYIAKNDVVIENTVAFIETGSFSDD